MNNPLKCVSTSECPARRQSLARAVETERTKECYETLERHCKGDVQLAAKELPADEAQSRAREARRECSTRPAKRQRAEAQNTSASQGDDRECTASKACEKAACARER